ncbi:MAG TPA: hypothetical protein PLP14_02295 [Chitinophagaceae bacterium]|nr:hypothetical protein [Chitinophagaceae bacterium]
MGIDELNRLFEKPAPVQTIQYKSLQDAGVQMDMLRLDLLHPQISGNKWYKLRYFIREAQEQKAAGVLSLGGPWSNHLHALAYTSQLLNLPSVGLVRGEPVSNACLHDCNAWNMKLHFVSRSDYRQKAASSFLDAWKNQYPDYYIIPEGGDAPQGISGAAGMLQGISVDTYSHIAIAVGTGTSFRGLLQVVPSETRLLGFCAMKGGGYLEALWENEHKSRYELFTGYHEGGFGSTNSGLENFIKTFYQETGIPLDRVYTAKMMRGLLDLCGRGYFAPTSRLLFIHTGGLQGNRSLS